MQGTFIESKQPGLSTKSLIDLFERFTANPACAAARAIVVPASDAIVRTVDREEVVQLLVAARKMLPDLRGIFMDGRHSSWVIFIIPCDMILPHNISVSK